MRQQLLRKLLRVWIWATRLACLGVLLLSTTRADAQTGACNCQDACNGADCPSFCTATQLTGDWLGARSALAAGGTTFLADNTSFFFGNPTGGVSQRAVYAGHDDFILLMDGEKLGVREGLSLKLRGEHRFGQTVVGNVGCFISPTVAADLPVFGSDQFYLTNVLLSQALSDNVAIYGGKMDTLDGDLNAFAHGRGKTQFSNMGFVFNPIVGATVPYSTLGAGIMYHQGGVPIFMFSVLNANDTTNTSGFRELFNDGLLLSVSLRLTSNFLNRPGHHLFGGTWNSRTYSSIGDAYLEYPNVVIPTTNGSWCLYWNADQYLIVDSADPTRGWGTFARAVFADENTSPLGWFLSFGVGGSSPLVGRPADTFGVGWYHAATSSQIGPLITSQVGQVGNGEGVECFYNYQYTPAVRLTPDLQVVIPAFSEISPSLILGVRAQLIF
jgi:porin